MAATVAPETRELARRMLLRRRTQSGGDPIARLLDPTFTAPLWEYEGSRVGLVIPGSLHPKQVAALENEATHRWLFWGNQVGKTTTGAVDCGLTALGRHPMQLKGLAPMPPVVQWASALSWDLWQRILLPELLTWIPRDRIVDAPEPNVPSLKRDIVIRADNGQLSRITGKSAEAGPGQYQSARVHAVWLDEEHPEAIWDEIQPRLLRFGGRTLATMTPLLGMTWVYGRIYEAVTSGQVERSRHWFSHAGLADNPAISAEALHELRRELAHNPSQLAAREHGLFMRPTGAVYPFDLSTHGVDLEGADLAQYIRTARLYGQLDLGKWRFAFAWGGVSPDGVLTMIDEVFSQNEDADTRARRIHTQLTTYGVGRDGREILIYGDCADPDGLLELNQALERIDSPFRVMAVEAKLKSRQAGVMRVESLLTRGALKVRRAMGRGVTWYQGRNASSSGRPVLGSRWIWEAQNWQYPKMPDGKVQKDDPDDNTADGADMMDGTRYLVMQWLTAQDVPVVRRAPTLLERLAQELRDLDAPPEQDSPYGAVLRQG